MLEHCKSRLCNFNQDYVRAVNGRISFTETAPEGGGTVTFDVVGEAIYLRAHNSPPLLWSLLNQRCAEGAFLTFNGSDVHLHIVEMKSTLGPGTWARVLAQFRGMYFSSLAVAGIMRVTTISSVTCYIAYKTERMDPVTTASPALIKTHVGKRNPYDGQTEWERRELELEPTYTASVVTVIRDSDTGDGHYGFVSVS